MRTPKGNSCPGNLSYACTRSTYTALLTPEKQCFDFDHLCAKYLRFRACVSGRGGVGPGWLATCRSAECTNPLHTTYPYTPFRCMNIAQQVSTTTAAANDGSVQGPCFHGPVHAGGCTASRWRSPSWARDSLPPQLPLPGICVRVCAFEARK